jgi:DNA polymerase I-like protein with 3'-5' exonuclease and polymerase domains
MESKDPVFCKMLWEGYDIHGEWSRKLAMAYPALIGGKRNLSDKKVMDDFRNACKSAWTFALLFGAELETVCSHHHLNAPVNVITPLYDEFWQTFSGIHDWQARIIKHYHEFGYVENLTGIRRRAPIRPNQLINAPIQADEAAVVFDAFNRLSELEDPVYQPVMEIHDDLTFILPLNRFEEHAEVIVDEMLRVTYHWINVPLVVEVSKGQVWYEMEKVGEFRSDQWWNTPERPSYVN